MQNSDGRIGRRKNSPKKPALSLLSRIKLLFPKRDTIITETDENKPASEHTETNSNEYDAETFNSDDNPEENKPSLIKRLSKRLMWFSLKAGFAFGSLFALYGVYLDAVIQDKLDGPVWQLPVAVYSRTIDLEPGARYSSKQMIQLLQSMQYRQVTKVIRSGEFSVDTNGNIEVWRREFIFPTGFSNVQKAIVSFNNNQIARIINLETGKPFATLSIDPRLITLLQSPNGEQRLFVERSRFPDTLIDILLAVEDRNFYNHEGVSLYSIGRAIVANAIAKDTVQGASTLTQQTVKNIFLSNERTYTRKFNEAYMAILLDGRYSKDRILELYLNEVYFGQVGDEEIRGFPLASLYYFGRNIDELSVDQQAMLVGMVKGAGIYNPWNKPANTIERRNVVLKVMQNLGYLDQNAYDMYSARPLDVRPRGGVITPQPAFMELVKQDLGLNLDEKSLKLLSGAKIFTTLDPLTQDAAESALQKTVPELREKTKLDDIEAASVVVDRFSGEVRAMVGGSNTQFPGFNRALKARRSIGSLAKPPVYLTALSQPDRFRLNTHLNDAPYTLKLSNGQTWSPNNYDRKFRGSVLLVDALAKSLNIPTVKLGMEVGLEEVITQLQFMGIPDKQLSKVPAILLGALNLTPIQTAQMYQTIASGGQRAQLTSVLYVLDNDNQLLFKKLPQATPALLPEAAYLTLFGMQQVVQQGTGRALLKDFSQYNLAGKTGTTNDLIDSWYVGIDGKEVAIFWVGRDNNKSSKLTGSTGALKVYESYLAHQTPLPLNLVRPSSIAEMNIDSAGNFSCTRSARVIPVWTNQPNILCQQGGSSPYGAYQNNDYNTNDHQFNQPEPTTQPVVDENGNLIIKENQINTPSPNSHLWR
ncbi:bifunctional glycosyl transferase/transpeptidase [Thorsellia anophelis]|uniref:Penicillin-binding protein 1B n=1 Tax=Thorsellia anophelis DSM 18579 TaxID=1123402 RepID=A0A1I0DD83_9GAMM|nr:bifunctional glycosyl transferase/transpeptidase [Thorsellia anophelis]SET29682.1 penicillin-binding protein 1B [Thorsellia anophelis DSM 18579]